MRSAIFLFSKTQFKQEAMGHVNSKQGHSIYKWNEEISGVNTKKSGICWGNPEEIK